METDPFMMVHRSVSAQDSLRATVVVAGIVVAKGC